MICMKCGKSLSSDAKFCPNCGTKVDPADMGFSEQTQTSGSGMIKGFFTSEGKGNYTNRTMQKLLTRDRIIGYLATFLMNLAAMVPFVSTRIFMSSVSYTLSDALDLVFDGSGTKTFFILAEIVFGWMFLIFKFVGKTRKMSTIGCVGSWILLACFIMQIMTSSGITIYFGFGIYVWIAGGILEIVSLHLDPRRPVDSDKQEKWRH